MGARRRIKPERWRTSWRRWGAKARRLLPPLDALRLRHHGDELHAEYLLAWRMALARDLLRRHETISDVAERVGYGSASAFSTAFTRHAGQPPSHTTSSLARDHSKD